MTSDTIKYIKATLLLIGTIVGVGMFGIPFVFTKSGILPGLILLAFLTFLTTLFHLMYGEIVLRTPESHRLPGYAAMYLGTFWGHVSKVSSFIGLVGILLAYLLLGGHFISGLFNVEPMTGFAVFLVAGALFLLFNVRKEALVGSIFSALLVGTILFFLAGIISSFSLGSFELFNGKYALLPYGVLLFALSGSLIIPDLAEIVGGRILKKAIVTGSIVPAVLYGLFALGVIGASGNNVSEDAISGLVPHLGGGVIALGQIVGLLAVFTSYIATGMNQKEMLTFDLRVSPVFAWALPVIFPAVLAALLKTSYIEVIGFVGGITLGVDLILTAAIFERARKVSGNTPEYTVGISHPAIIGLIGCMLVGVGYEVLHFFL